MNRIGKLEEAVAELSARFANMEYNVNTDVENVRAEFQEQVAALEEDMEELKANLGSGIASSEQAENSGSAAVDELREEVEQLRVQLLQALETSGTNDSAKSFSVVGHKQQTPTTAATSTGATPPVSTDQEPSGLEPGQPGAVEVLQVHRSDVHGEVGILRSQMAQLKGVLYGFQSQLVDLEATFDKRMQTLAFEVSEHQERLRMDLLQYIKVVVKSEVASSMDHLLRHGGGGQSLSPEAADPPTQVTASPAGADGRGPEHNMDVDAGQQRPASGHELPQNTAAQPATPPGRGSVSYTGGRLDEKGDTPASSGGAASSAGTPLAEQGKQGVASRLRNRISSALNFAE
ncbi:unnamed protein product [Amoebophrya sp. A25]|nr:unnamed protein product [Amoebophrya sp. A25]|eukprot:GSA25T00015333001.1